MGFLRRGEETICAETEIFAEVDTLFQMLRLRCRLIGLWYKRRVCTWIRQDVEGKQRDHREELDTLLLRLAEHCAAEQDRAKVNGLRYAILWQYDALTEQE